MKRVTARTPTRIDLAGGTLDLWPIHHLLDAKATVNVGVSLDAEIVVEPAQDRQFHLVSQDQGLTVSGSLDHVSSSTKLPLLGLLLGALWDRRLPPIRITTSAKSPQGAGLGGSSCLGIAVAGAIQAARHAIDGSAVRNEDDLVRVVQDVEARLISAPTGVQDYWGGMRGRVNVLTFPYGRVNVETLAPRKVAGLEDELLICYSGRSRASAINNWEIFKRLFDGDKALLATFNQIGIAAEACAEAVRDGNLARVLEHSAAEWHLRLKLWPNIETAETRKIDQASKSAGAKFSRVCGAGGGGVMAIFAPKEKRAAVAAEATRAGGSILDASVADYGLTIEVS